MTKIAEDAALELPLNDERLTESELQAGDEKLRQAIGMKRTHWNPSGILRQMNNRRELLLSKRDELTLEIEKLDAAILALG